MSNIVNCKKINGVISEESGARGMLYRQIIPKVEGKTPGITYNDIIPGGNTKDHQHAGIHITYIVCGHGQLRSGDKITEVNEGDLIYIDPFERHCFVNTGDEMMTLLGFQGV